MRLAQALALYCGPGHRGSLDGAVAMMMILLLFLQKQNLAFGTSAASLSESSCLLHESRTNIIVIMTLRSPVESAHDSGSRIGVRERLDLASAPASRRRTRLSLC